MDWTTYVRNIVGNEKHVEVSRRTGVDQTTLSRWLSGEYRGVTHKNVGRFARGYDRPVIEAFLAAGFLTEAEASAEIIHPHALDYFTIDELLAELARRTKAKSAQSVSS